MLPWIVVGIFFVAVFAYKFAKKETPEEKDERLEREERERAETARKAAALERKAAIEKARAEAERLSLSGTFFEVTTGSSINGYHIVELGWVKYIGEERSDAEKRLRMLAAQKYEKANVLIKLTHGLNDEKYKDGNYADGRPRFKNRKVKYWEAMACLAVPKSEVDQSPRKWSDKLIIVDGSNVAHWDANAFPSLKPVSEVIETLTCKGIRPIVVFDANIGYKVFGKHLSLEEIKKMMGVECEAEIVPAGTVADRRIVELAELHSAPIVTNDLYRDSVKARHIPKRRGFYIFGDAEILPAR
jgi:hypothetical protein